MNLDFFLLVLEGISPPPPPPVLLPKKYGTGSDSFRGFKNFFSIIIILKGKTNTG